MTSLKKIKTAQGWMDPLPPCPKSRPTLTRRTRLLFLLATCALLSGPTAGLVADEPSVVAPERLTLRATTALYEDDGIRFKAFADAGTTVELREELPDRGMLRVAMPGTEESFLCWPEAVGRRQAVPFPRGENVTMTVPGTKTSYLESKGSVR
jgi:hypothetical protein